MYDSDGGGGGGGGGGAASASSADDDTLVPFVPFKSKNGPPSPVAVRLDPLAVPPQSSTHVPLTAEHVVRKVVDYFCEECLPDVFLSRACLGKLIAPPFGN